MDNQNRNQYNNEFVNDLETRKEFREYYIDEFGLEPNDKELTEYILDFIDDNGIELVSSNNGEDSPFSKLLGMIFIIWFIASFVGMFYFFDNNPDIGVIIFGQYFLVFGILALVNKTPIGWLFFLIGLGCIVVPILIRHPEYLSFEVNWEFLGMISFGLIFAIVGIIIDYSIVSENKKLKERCSSRVDATIISIKDGIYPIYEYVFFSKKYKVKGIQVKDCFINQRIQLLINPNEPSEVYFDNKKEKIFMHLFTMSFVASGIFVIVMSFIHVL